jgi:hypothetical protein
MREHLLPSILVVCLWIAGAHSVAADAGRVRAARDPRYVLEQIQKRLDRISNYQCRQITTQTRWNQRDPNRVATDIKRKYIAYDGQGRRRIRELSDNLDASTYIWDGTQTIEVREQVKRDGTVVYSASVFPGKCYQARGGHLPWNYLGGFLADALTKALAKGTRINVEAAENGHCRVEVYSDGGTVIVAVLDPARGYLPIVQGILSPGGMHPWNEIAFREIDPGVWFPVAVRTQSPHRPIPASVQVAPRLRFGDIRINDPDFERLLSPELPSGSTVADMVRGVRYVVDRKQALSALGSGSLSPGAGEAVRAGGSRIEREQAGIENVYRLDPNEALKRIARPFPAGREAFTLKHEPDVAPSLEAAFDNTIYVWQRGDDDKPTVRYAGMGFLNLSEILQCICGLEVFEYSGPENLLELRLTGDWVVRRGASRAARLRSLERIVYEETSLRIRFEKGPVDTPIVRATGIFQYHGLAGAWGEDDVQLFSDVSGDDRSAYYTGGGSGSLAHFLRHLANRTGRPFVDDTLSSDAAVSWSDYKSSRLAPYDGPRHLYRRDLARLLENVSQQTGLRFATERRTIDEWVVGIKP